MAINITNTKKTEMVMTNNLAVDGRVIYVQQYTINSEDPYNFTDQSHYEYSATSEDKALYMANKASFRQQQTAYEDEVFAKIAEMVAQNQAK